MYAALVPSPVAVKASCGVMVALGSGDGVTEGSGVGSGVGSTTGSSGASGAGFSKMGSVVRFAPVGVELQAARRVTKVIAIKFFIVLILSFCFVVLD